MIKPKTKHMKVLPFALTAATHLLAVFPLKPSSKQPAIAKWPACATKLQVKVKGFFENFPNANYAVATGTKSKIWVLDVDGIKGRKSLNKLIAANRQLPKTVRVKTPRGEHIYFRHPGGKIGNKAGFRPGLDVRGDGGYVVGAGSKSAQGVQYRYKKARGLGEVKLARAPKWLLKIIAKKTVPTAANVPAISANATVGKAYVERALERECKRVVNAPPHQANHTLYLASFRLGQMLPLNLIPEATIRSQLTNAALTRGQTEQETAGTVESGLKAGRLRPRALLPANESGDLTATLAKLGETDAHNAERFVRRYGQGAMWTSSLGWLVYDGRRWAVDDHNRRLKLAVEAMKAVAAEAQYLSGKKRKKRRAFSYQSLNKHQLDKLLATAQPDLAVEDSKLDTDPQLLNVLNGTLDLKTGELHPHNPADLITRLCNVKYDAGAKCPQFMAFLRQATGGNKDLMRFLKKAAGYSLTGQWSEQVLFFLHGPTRTGKSTLINVLRDLVGDYGINTPIKTILVKHYDNDIPVDLARMKGARIVTASENNPNQQLDEAKVKSLTGGDKQTARFMRQNPFDFQPEFKLWIAANDLPKVRATDDAIWNRFIVLAFNNQVEGDGRDQKLPEKLRTELEGILAWAVRGAVLWNNEGLHDRNLFDLEKERWRKQSDTVGRFFHECCQVVAPSESIPSGVFYARYKQWCTSNSEQPCSTKMFKAGLIELNVGWKKTNKSAMFMGVKLTK